MLRAVGPGPGGDANRGSPTHREANAVCLRAAEAMTRALGRLDCGRSVWLTGDRQLGRLLGSTAWPRSGFRADRQSIPVTFNRFKANAIDIGELIDRLEGAVLLAIAHDGFGLCRPNAVEFEQFRFRGGIDVDGPRRQGCAKW